MLPRISRSAFLVFLSSVVVALAVPCLAQDTCGCDFSASCCSAAYSCPSDEFCVCWAICGVAPIGCWCDCMDDIPVEGGNELEVKLDASMKMDLSKCSGSSPSVTLGEFAELAEARFDWDFDVDTNVADTSIVAGSWSGTFEQLLSGFATSHGVTVTFNSTLEKVTFSE